MGRLRTVFMGSDAISLPLLDSLVEEHSADIELVGVYTQPDRPHGRGMKLHKTPIKEWAEQHALPISQPEKLDQSDVTWLRKNEVDLLLVMAYGRLLSTELLTAPRLPPLNFHASLLPHLRGASPIETAIATGERHTGVTLMRIVKKMDAGPILDQEIVDIRHSDTRPQVYQKIAQACVPLFTRALPAILTNRLEFREQDDNRVTYCRIITKEDGAVDFTAPAEEIFNRSRAFQPWPGLYFDYQGTRIRIGAARWEDKAVLEKPGTILDSGASLGSLKVATGRGVLLIEQLQRPGGRMLPVQEFLRGFEIPTGTQLQGGKMHKLVARKRSEFEVFS